MQIAGREIGPHAPPFVIAEMSANHDGSIEAALRIIAEAQRCGADAVKIQTYTADTMTLDSDGPDFQLVAGRWAGRSLHDLYQWAHTPWDWHARLFEHARRLGITLFSTPFDATAVDLLEDLGTPAYKIASFEVVDLELIRYTAATGKPMIISTGMATADEIQEAVDVARAGGCGELALLRCVSAYPAPAAEYNLRAIPDMGARFGTVVGLSDHTVDNTVAISSVALGASVIEKHFTLDRGSGGPDAAFSITPEELAALCRNARTAWEALGAAEYQRRPSEGDSLQFRRSLYVVRDVRAGEPVDASNVRSIRPGYGLACRNLPRAMSMRFAVDVQRGTPLSWEHLTTA